jgi:predicted esterase
MRRGHAAVMAFMASAMMPFWCDVTLAAGTPRVILLRGWFGVFSMGLDSLTEQLKTRGINAEVAGHLSWQNEVTEILRERSAGRTGPLVLVGHSQGANNVIDIARALEASHVTVDLLITLSPFMQNRVPANVAKAINYYQAPGWGQPLEADQGFHGKLINVNLSDDPTISHIGIDKSEKIQTEIVREISAVK